MLALENDLRQQVKDKDAEIATLKASELENVQLKERLEKAEVERLYCKLNRAGDDYVVECEHPSKKPSH